MEITVKDHTVLIDDEDIEKVSGYTWHIRKLGSSKKPYVYHSRRGQKALALHRLLLEAPDGQVVDHVNGNPLDNRKGNLRVCAQKENARNNRKVDSVSGFRGVTEMPEEFCLRKGMKNRYWVRIRVDGKQISFGTFPTAEEAAVARDRATLFYFGEYGYLNFPERLEEYRANPYTPAEKKNDRLCHCGQPVGKKDHRAIYCSKKCKDKGIYWKAKGVSLTA